jgi:hypothetical protein
MGTRRKEFAVCVRNKGYEVSLERRKIYAVLPDPDAAKCKQLRVVDESGEDYLYPQAYFAAIELPRLRRKSKGES